VNLYKEIILSGMLHDIGKFIQRTGQKNFKSKNEDLLCPFNKTGQYFSHQHVLFTDKFLQENKTVFPQGLQVNKIVDLASKHHKPDSPHSAIIAIADWLSSGADRKEA